MRTEQRIGPDRTGQVMLDEEGLIWVDSRPALPEPELVAEEDASATLAEFPVYDDPSWE